MSPQRLVHYRDNWYLDSWCHLRKALRSFSIDAILQLEVGQEVAIEIDEDILDRELESGYGIFSGVKTREAVLRFRPELARWVSREQWHPKQKGEFDESGFHLLRIPYSQDTELVMDILRHGADVEVLQPQQLRQKVIDRIEEMRELY